MRFALIKRVLSTAWLVTVWLALASPLQASHLESATGLDFHVAGTVLSTLTFVDPQAASGNFNSATPGATPGEHVTAERYTYVTGSGSGGYGGGYGGGGFGGGGSSSTPTYTYVEGANSFNPNNVDWQAFRDASQNFGLPKAGNSGKTISGGGGFGGF